MHDYGTTIRIWREHRNYNMKQFAKLVGISPETVSSIECGAHPQKRTLNKIEAATGLKLCDQDTIVNDPDYSDLQEHIAEMAELLKWYRQLYVFGNNEHGYDGGKYLEAKQNLVRLNETLIVGPMWEDYYEKITRKHNDIQRTS